MAESYSLLMQHNDLKCLMELAEDQCYFEREIAAYLIAQIEDEPLNGYCDLLMKLSNDSVPNVRAVAKISKKANLEGLDKLMNKLEVDEDEDVRKAMAA